MMRRSHVLLSAFALASLGAADPRPSVVSVGGDVGKPDTFAVEDLEKLKPVTATWKEHDKSHEVYGIPLDKLLLETGFTPGPSGKLVPATDSRGKRAGWKKILRVSANDGFEAIFSCAELWEGMGPTRAMLIWKMDGKPLPPSAGPFRVVVLTDGDPSRAIYKVTTLEVIDMRKK